MVQRVGLIVAVNCCYCYQIDAYLIQKTVRHTKPDKQILRTIPTRTVHTIRILLSSVQRILSEPQQCTGLFKMIAGVLTTCHTRNI